MSQRSHYFAATENRRIRDDLVFAVAQVVEPKVAVDCGCGAGPDSITWQRTASWCTGLTWKNICECLDPRGIFCGSFLGPEDTMASKACYAADFWPVAAVFEEQEVLALFADFEMLSFKVHQYSGTTPSGQPHDWHIFAVVAQKSVGGLRV